MGDVVAVKITESKGRAHFFLTWGRIFDRVDPKGLETVIAKHAWRFGIKNPKSVAACDSLKKASHARYFYESLFHLSQEKIPFDVSTYGPWRAKKKKQILFRPADLLLWSPKEERLTQTRRAIILTLSEISQEILRCALNDNVSCSRPR